MAPPHEGQPFDRSGVMMMTETQTHSSHNGIRHFLDLTALPAAELRGILEASRTMKRALDERTPAERAAAEMPLAGQVLAMVFERPSTRTRVSFDVAMRQLGGESIVLSADDMQLGRGETLEDTARVLSRYVDAIMIRILDHASLSTLAEHASVPVINGLTRDSHPCQLMADVMTFEEHRGPIAGRTVAWAGDTNNVTRSWVHAAAQFDFTLRLATPQELAPSDTMMAEAKSIGARVEWTADPFEAVADVDCVVTDTWVSMGDVEAARRHNMLKPYQVNQRLMDAAGKDAIFMHCLPAHRGEEVTDEVMDGPQSVVFDGAENRLHAQKGILAWCLGTKR
jgi:ornithine carbamoyltransferase